MLRGISSTEPSALNQASIDANMREWRIDMRTTVTLDDDLLAEAQAYTGITEKSALMREALKQLVQREAARRLALMGGSCPDLVAPPRRRFGVE